MNLREHILGEKKVALWGIGYLGFTMLMRLQSYGFKADVVDLNSENTRLFLNREYPSKSQVASWSTRGTIPKLDENKIEVFESPKWIFNDCARIHFICLPANYRNQEYNQNLITLAKLFRENCNTGKTLVVFQSVSGPGSIERDFIGNLGAENQNIEVATAFRTDWSIETFMGKTAPQIVASNKPLISEELKDFFSLIDIEIQICKTIREAELIVNAQSALEYHISAFFNQLSLSYPNEDISGINSAILSSIRLQECQLGLGFSGVRMSTAVDNLLRETKYLDHISLLREGGAVHLGTLYVILDYLKRRNFRKILLLGVQEQGEFNHSPSLFIASSLAQSDTRVYIHDPDEPSEKLDSLIDGVNYAPFPNHNIDNLDCILVFTNHYFYRHLSNIASVKYIEGKVDTIIDLQNTFSNLSFEQTTHYCLGDGTLNLLT